MSWFYLLLGGLLEIVWAVGMKYTEGFTKPLPTVITVAGIILSMLFLALAVRTLPLGTAYAVWTGIGVVGAAVCGFILFGDPFSWLRLLCLVLIISGIAGLKLLSKSA